MKFSILFLIPAFFGIPSFSDTLMPVDLAITPASQHRLLITTTKPVAFTSWTLWSSADLTQWKYVAQGSNSAIHVFVRPRAGAEFFKVAPDKRILPPTHPSRAQK